MSRKVAIKWSKSPNKHNYPAALSYLSLFFDEKTAATYVRKLKRAVHSEFKAKDIFRASALSLLGVSNGHVDRDKQRIKAGEVLSPVLLVRDATTRRVIVADGYHRLCAVYSYDEDAVIPCRIV
jgi:hypothetical protein